MEEVSVSVFIEKPIDEVWNAFVDPSKIEGWCGDPVDMIAQEGAEFSLWGGDVYGKNLEVIKNQKIVQTWWRKDWVRPSRAIIEFEQKPDGTEITVLHERVPEEEIDDVAEIWEDRYFRPFKELLEEGTTKC